jgi:hypothetical protein
MTEFAGPRILVRDVVSTTAEQLLDNISFRGPELRYRFRPRSWIFRGQKRDFPLLPTARRIGARLKSPTGQWRPVEDWSNHQQIGHEIATIAEFFWQADASGLSIPGDSQKLRHYFSKFRETPLGRIADRFYGKWPPRVVLSLLALAQHYRVPTRLLDWSYSPLIAAYFAASGAVMESECGVTAPNDRNSVIWAFALPAYTLEALDSQVRPREKRITIVTAPPSENDYLRAQQGVFTLIESTKVDLKAKVNQQPLAEELSECWRIVDWGIHPPLLRFIFPISEAKKLMWILAREGVTAASVFPGFRGVADALSEQRVLAGAGAG